eukprot:5656371-Prymnesium_polylepis.1
MALGREDKAKQIQEIDEHFDKVIEKYATESNPKPVFTRTFKRLRTGDNSGRAKRGRHYHARPSINTQNDSNSTAQTYNK